MRKGGLGKGLEAIFAENDTEDRNATVTLKLNEIEPNRSQPRKEFDEGALAELADSLSRHGMLQPLLVRPLMGGGYQIVAGERRWRAARMAGLTEVPAIIRELADHEVMELALIENLQREDLTPLEEAQGYQTLMDTYGMTQEEVAHTVGKSRPAVANALRLLNLPQEILNLVNEGKISSGHARTLLGFQDKEQMLEAAKLVVSQGISVREREKMVKRANEAAQKKPVEKKRNRIQYYDEVQLAVGEHLGRKVQVNGNKIKGTLQIEFYGEEDLANLLGSLKLSDENFSEEK